MRRRRLTALTLALVTTLTGFSGAEPVTTPGRDLVLW